MTKDIKISENCPRCYSKGRHISMFKSQEGILFGICACGASWTDVPENILQGLKKQLDKTSKCVNNCDIHTTCPKCHKEESFDDNRLHEYRRNDFVVYMYWPDTGDPLDIGYQIGRIEELTRIGHGCQRGYRIRSIGSDHTKVVEIDEDSIIKTI